MFVPRSPDGARRLDQDMREDLADSLGRLGEMAAAVLPADAGMEPALAHIRAHRVQPGVFARYYDLVFALQRQDYVQAATLWREIAVLAADAAELRVIPYDPSLLGDDCDRFGRLAGLGDGGGHLFAPPPGPNWKSFEPTALDALSLLGRIDPAWSGEFESLVTRVIAAVPGEDARRRFASASSFMIWGAIFTNVGQARDRLQVLVSLMHEATHELLFGLARREPLVANPVGERYLSPLRPDPRPMDGVFHATYVAARLTRFAEVLASAEKQLTPEEAAWARARITGFRQRFREGHAVIVRDAQLTPLGRRLMEEAADHVLAAA